MAELKQTYFSCYTAVRSSKKKQLTDSGFHYEAERKQAAVPSADRKNEAVDTSRQHGGARRCRAFGRLWGKVVQDVWSAAEVKFFWASFSIRDSVSVWTHAGVPSVFVVQMSVHELTAASILAERNVNKMKTYSQLTRRRPCISTSCCHISARVSSNISNNY